jgi:predicted XRE-type DNA-binding protein
MKRKNETKLDDRSVIESSGNIFADMGLPNPEERLLKAKLASLINDAIEEHGWTQQKTADYLGLEQPHVSDLSRGRLSRFSVERLLYLLDKLERHVTITVRRKKGSKPLEEIVVGSR